MRELFGENRLFFSIVVGAFFFYAAYTSVPKFLDWIRWQSIGTRDYILEKLELMFIKATPNQVLLGMVVTALIPGLLVFLLTLPHIGAALFFFAMFSVASWFVPRLVVDSMFQKRVFNFNVQMIDGLGLMANGMKSGLSIVQAIGLVKNEMPNPMAQEMEYVLQQNQLGVSVEEAFQNLAKRIPSDEVNMFVTSVVILKETGGNLAETFETIVSTIRERVKMESKIGAMMTQNLYQGIIVFCMPFGMLAMFHFSDPDFLKPMFSETLGFLILGVAFTLQCAGGFLILKITKIKV